MENYLAFLNIVPNLINNLLKENNINKKDLDFILLHQASNIIKVILLIE